MRAMWRVGTAGLLIAFTGALIASVGASSLTASPGRPRCPLRSTPERMPSPRYPATIDVIVGHRFVVFDFQTGESGSFRGHSSVCSREKRRRWTLGHALFGSDNARLPVPRRPVTITGWHAAWSWSEGGGGEYFSGLDTIDARTGRQTTVDSIGPAAEQSGPQRYVRVVLRGSGAMAWSTRDGIFACRRCQDPSGRLSSNAIRVIAPATADPRSLRATRRGVAWRESGAARGARLP
jgi:hypothetical protein